MRKMCRILTRAVRVRCRSWANLSVPKMDHLLDIIAVGLGRILSKNQDPKRAAEAMPYTGNTLPRLRFGKGHLQTRADTPRLAQNSRKIMGNPSVSKMDHLLDLISVGSWPNLG